MTDDGDKRLGASFLEDAERYARAQERLRARFDEDAERYARARPRYPAALFADLASVTAAGSGSHVLEVGPGTGQATRSLADLGSDVTAVELGENLARIAARALSDRPSVTIVNAAFEEWPLPPERFDLAVVATAWHWLNPAVRSQKIERALRRGGHLAIISTHHVKGGSLAFFDAVQVCYSRLSSQPRSHHALVDASSVQTFSDSSLESFAPTSCTRYEEEISYSADEYVDLLMTYSDHRDLEPAVLARLLECVHALITQEFDGRISKRYLFELSVFSRR